MKVINAGILQVSFSLNKIMKQRVIYYFLTRSEKLQLAYKCKITVKKIQSNQRKPKENVLNVIMIVRASVKWYTFY